LVGEVFRGGCSNHLGSREPTVLPIERAVKHPPEDSRIFWNKLFLKPQVRRSWFKGERREVKASAIGFIDVMEHWPMVADDRYFELGLIGEEVLAHEAGGDWVAAS
jgi:hypothetical protein